MSVLCFSISHRLGGTSKKGAFETFGSIGHGTQSLMLDKYLTTKLHPLLDSITCLVHPSNRPQVPILGSWAPPVQWESGECMKGLGCCQARAHLGEAERTEGLTNLVVAMH
jgi:hypothetical protein